MKIKRIKSSHRGLTFSLDETDVPVGSHYRYIVDVKNKTVNIILDENGSHTVSRKKSGSRIKPLFDIRSREVKELIQDAQFIELEITEGCIYAYPRKARKAKIRAFQSSVVSLEDVLGKRAGRLVLALPTVSLMAAGMEGDTSFFDMPFSVENGSYLEGRSDAVNIMEDTKKVYDVVSLFSGAGLFDKAFKDDVKFRFVYGCDFCKDVIETYRYNIGNHIECRDIREVSVTEIPDADVTIGGPCCQAYSNSNRHNMESEEAEEKRLLIDDFARLVKSKVWVIENVPTILTRNQGFYYERLCNILSDYDITATVVSDHEVGGYSTRKRAIIIGSKIGKITLPDFKVLTYKTVRDALSKVDASWYNYSDITVPSEETARKMSFVPQGGNWQDIPAPYNTYGKDTHSSVMRRLAYDEPSITLTNFRKSNILHPTENRILSVAEAAAIMGLPKEFRFFGNLSAKQQMVSNGVSYAIGRYVKNAVGKALDRFYGNEDRKMPLVAAGMP